MSAPPDRAGLLRRRRAEAVRRWRERHPGEARERQRLRDLCRLLVRASLRKRGEIDHRPAGGRGGNER